MNVVWIILLIVCAAALIFWLAPGVTAAMMVFFRRHRLEIAQSKYYFKPYREEMARCWEFLQRQPHRRVAVRAYDGVPLSALWFDRGGGKTAVLLHGYNASAMTNFSVSGAALWERGYNLLLVDQRAHGESGGRFSGFGLAERNDLLSWLDWLSRETATKRTVVWGVSMGCAAASYVSDRIGDRVQALVLDCGYTSPREQFASVGRRRHVPWRLTLPVIRATVRLLKGVDINESTTAALSRTTIPAAFLYGEADDTVSAETFGAIYDACASEKIIITVPGAAHTMAYICASAAQKEQLLAFLEKQIRTEEKTI
ncbi:MAG: alpha/beta hydrolase [Oscillospiraceae bacterium]|nr:alpha/beta hydrolase [Oscillospiraceae bacterium]